MNLPVQTRLRVEFPHTKGDMQPVTYENSETLKKSIEKSRGCSRLERNHVDALGEKNHHLVFVHFVLTDR